MDATEALCIATPQQQQQPLQQQADIFAQDCEDSKIPADKHEMNYGDIADLADLGPETNIDAVDDVVESSLDENVDMIVNFEKTDAEPIQQEASENADVGNIADSDSEDEWNYYRGNQTTIPLDKPKTNLLEQELDEDMMASQLNPDAAEFVPVSGVQTLPVPKKDYLIDEIVAQSPSKVPNDAPEQMITLPSDVEFETEAKLRPGEMSPFNDSISLHDNMQNITGKATTLPEALLLNFSLNNGHATTPISPSDPSIDSFKREDVMAMSFYQEVGDNNPFNVGTDINPYDPNAVQMLPLSDSEDECNNSKENVVQLDCKIEKDLMSPVNEKQSPDGANSHCPWNLLTDEVKLQHEISDFSHQEVVTNEVPPIIENKISIFEKEQNEMNSDLLVETLTCTDINSISSDPHQHLTKSKDMEDVISQDLSNVPEILPVSNIVGIDTSPIVDLANLRISESIPEVDIEEKAQYELTQESTIETNPVSLTHELLDSQISELCSNSSNIQLVEPIPNDDKNSHIQEMNEPPHFANNDILDPTISPDVPIANSNPESIGASLNHIKSDIEIFKVPEVPCERKVINAYNQDSEIFKIPMVPPEKKILQDEDAGVFKVPMIPPERKMLSNENIQMSAKDDESTVVHVLSEKIENQSITTQKKVDAAKSGPKMTADPSKKSTKKASTKPNDLISKTSSMKSSAVKVTPKLPSTELKNKAKPAPVACRSAVTKTSITASSTTQQRPTTAPSRLLSDRKPTVKAPLRNAATATIKQPAPIKKTASPTVSGTSSIVSKSTTNTTKSSPGAMSIDARRAANVTMRCKPNKDSNMVTTSNSVPTTIKKELTVSKPSEKAKIGSKPLVKPTTTSPHQTLTKSTLSKDVSKSINKEVPKPITKVLSKSPNKGLTKLTNKELPKSNTKAVPKTISNTPGVVKVSNKVLPKTSITKISKTMPIKNQNGGDEVMQSNELELIKEPEVIASVPITNSNIIDSTLDE